MDQTDVGILAHLVSEPLASVQSIARQFGLARTSVHDRINRMSRIGVFRGVRGFPNPRLFGMHRVVCIFEAPPQMPSSRELFRLPHVIGYTISHEEQLSVRCYLPETTKEPPKELIGLVGKRPRRILVQASPAVPAAERWLSRRQWTLLAALLPNLRQPAAQLAAKTGMTSKTVSRIRSGLLRKAQLQWEVDLLPNRAQDIVLYHLWVRGIKASDLALLRHQAPQLWIERESSEPRGLFLIGAASSLADALGVPSRLKRAANAPSASLVIRRHAEYNVTRLAQLCEDEARRQATALGQSH